MKLVVASVRIRILENQIFVSLLSHNTDNENVVKSMLLLGRLTGEQDYLNRS